MVAFEMVSGEIPFASQAIDPLSFALKIVKGDRPDFPKYTPQFWRDMVESCWHSDPLRRPTCQELRETLNSWQNYIYCAEKGTSTPQGHNFMEELELAERNRATILPTNKKFGSTTYLSQALFNEFATSSLHTGNLLTKLFFL